jgi:uncharacterized protein YdeI (YjbR/CyaY-like superfamily)
MTGEVRAQSKPAFFEAASDLRRWLAANHETADELWVGLYRVGSGRKSITWPEVVDEALCFGWIDGIRQSIDDTSYKNRITPRRKGSNWSAINIARVAELEVAGRMRPAGRRAFEARDEARSATYSYERATARLDDEAAATFRANSEAWSWFEQAPASYRRAATHWVTSAVKPETRDRRLQTLIADSAAGRTVKPLTSTRATKEKR